jgi:hypothetical protein
MLFQAIPSYTHPGMYLVIPSIARYILWPKYILSYTRYNSVYTFDQSYPKLCTSIVHTLLNSVKLSIYQSPDIYQDKVYVRIPAWDGSSVLPTRAISLNLWVNFKCEHFILHLTQHFHLALGTGWPWWSMDETTQLLDPANTVLPWWMMLLACNLQWIPTLNATFGCGIMRTIMIETIIAIIVT